MNTGYTFPFGEPVRTVEQGDRSPKKVFVLGVYASAVHARWVGGDGKMAVSALAVASEPCIFWRGNGGEEIISRISVPAELGRLLPAAKNMNGPSGIALDELFLDPMGVTREDAWLCDLVPHSCRNPGQAKAIEKQYEPLMEKYGLPAVTTPPVPKVLADDKRREKILAEIREADPETILLLGDQPIRWFLKHFDSGWKRLSDFGVTADTYGRRHETDLAGKTRNILPLCHPRQAARLGSHSTEWAALHEQWAKEFTP